jgi:hypothetical protein
VDDANNRVGAGIASPSAPLHVAADSSTLSLRISGRSSDDRSDVEFYENDNTTKLTFGVMVLVVFIRIQTHTFLETGLQQRLLD